MLRSCSAGSPRSPRVLELAGIGGDEFGRPVRSYLNGRLTHQVLPMLRSEETWQHPLVAGAFDADLRNRLLAAVDRLPGFRRRGGADADRRGAR